MSIVTIVGILVTMAVPSYQQSVVKAREAVLTRDLFTVRDLLDQHRADKGKYPDSLKDLVTVGYLKTIPMDPFTRSTSTWQEIYEATEGGVFDIHSGSDLVGTDGVPYNQWCWWDEESLRTPRCAVVRSLDGRRLCRPFSP